MTRFGGGIVWRWDATAADVGAVRALVDSTGVFTPAEIDVAEELVRERLSKGDDSGYYFVFAERDGQLLGYASYGPIPCTVGSFDLYWIAVEHSCQGQGLGRAIIAEAERLIAASHGRHIYIETSNRAQYAPTRAFYLRCGYEEAALFRDFYAPGDDKVVYVKRRA